ncbi:hypothetical protein KGF56_000329 [Candida oxycetoniae]|uniref:J domain-containing protein n=1 Tax=Candida oxycetoniae TaxID=497107 RepID=A0AAI9T0Z1_9ASCO|nr:uncharacterized protein KGF56_000329 [Candida oxycetoniae]KAI3406868.2 hypothetical protein KGF56_000329 [Candida oxycetoniae]
MGVPFPDIDPYQVLGVESDATPILIKKTYKKLCLKHHPDKKLQQRKDGEENNKEEEKEDEELFTKIQFAFSILNDPIKRNRYDTLGSLSDVDYGDEEGFNWKEYFQSMNDKITIEMIEEDKVKYQGSDEERHDIISNFVYYDGDFLKLFEVIPHLEFTEFEEQRVFKIIESEISSIDVDKTIIRSWEKYAKSRKTKVKNMLKKLAKEAKEAKELERVMMKDNKTKGSDLKTLIRSRQNHRLDSLIQDLESKYGKKHGKKRQAVEMDIDDGEFEKIQQEMLKRSKYDNE